MANETNKFTVGQIIYMIIFIFLFPAFILSLAGDWFWIEGWIFSIWFLVMTLSIGIYLQLNDPTLLAERQKVRADDQKNGISILYGWPIYRWLHGLLLCRWMPNDMDGLRYTFRYG